jgi:hypothetical protein
MMDQLEREVREMLKERAVGIPAEYEPSTELLGKASRRRATKIGVLGVACAVVLAGVAGTMLRETTQKKSVQTLEHPTIPAVGCATEVYGASGARAGDASPRIPPALEVRGVDATTAAKLGQFASADNGSHSVEPWTTVLAPRGYQCRTDVSRGSQIFAVEPRLGAFGKNTAPFVTVFRGPLGDASSIEGQCQHLPLASVQAWARANSRPGTDCRPPSGLHRIAQGTYAWGRGANQGVAVVDETEASPPTGAYDLMNCRLAEADAALCNAIIADFVARNHGAVVKPTTKTVSRDGKIGSLQLGVSAQTAVIATAGSPAATAIGNFGAGFPNFSALGYDCTTSPSNGRDPIVLQPTTHGPYCKTIYYINATSNTLGGFSTTSNTFVTEMGTSVGITEAAAAKSEGQKSVAGCDTGISLGQPRTIFINVGTKPTDRVNRISAELPTSALGVLFC